MWPYSKVLPQYVFWYASYKINLIWINFHYYTTHSAKKLANAQSHRPQVSEQSQLAPHSIKHLKQRMGIWPEISCKHYPLPGVLLQALSLWLSHTAPAGHTADSGSQVNFVYRVKCGVNLTAFLTFKSETHFKCLESLFKASLCAKKA